MQLTRTVWAGETACHRLGTAPRDAGSLPGAVLAFRAGTATSSTMISLCALLQQLSCSWLSPKVPREQGGSCGGSSAVLPLG